jgi:molecular chaperone DnaK (HSP70)
MGILVESGIRKIDIDLIKFFFDVKCSTLEELEEHSSGMFSTQQKLKDIRAELLNFVLSYKNRNSIFYIFLGGEKEQNLKIVVSNVEEEPDDLTKRFAITIDEDLTEFKVKQLSLSSKVLTLINL